MRANTGEGKKDMARGARGKIGLVARVVDRAFQDPAMSGGLFVLSLTLMAIVSNAMFLQPTSHPKPLFQTRAAEPALAALRTPSPTPAPRAQPASSDIAEVPLPRGRDARTAAAPVEQATAAQPQPPVPQVVSDPYRQRAAAIQRELARLGLYSGSIDGITGSRTKAAIARYQAAGGLPVTGEPSPQLLELLATPTPRAPVRPGAEATTTYQGLDIAAIERANAVASERDRYRRIQVALNKIGYGPLGVDGQVGPETISAIRRFELDNGLDISGTASDRVLTTLVAIGALDST